MKGADTGFGSTVGVFRGDMKDFLGKVTEKTAVTPWGSGTLSENTKGQKGLSLSIGGKGLGASYSEIETNTAFQPTKHSAFMNIASGLLGRVFKKKKMSDVDNYLANYSYALIGCGVSVFVFFIFLIDVELSSELLTFISLESLFLIVGGVGVRFRHKVGYYIFVSFLSILFFHFPVGTYFAHKTIKYLKENNIKDHFFRKKKSKP